MKRQIEDGVKTVEVLDALPERLRCRNCGVIYDYTAPAIWFPTDQVHEFTQSLVIMTHSLCCGVLHHTEPVATVVAYLRPVKEHARLMCNLINQHQLAGRPQPQWLVEAWARWEASFDYARPKR